MPNTAFIPDPNESFPRLANPPIVEAVIHWQARAQNRLEFDALQAALVGEFSGYNSRKPIHRVGVAAEVSAESEPIVTKIKNWDGFRLKSDDEKHTIQFSRDGVLFSRTNGYEHWEQFVSDAKEVWRTYLRIAQPLEVQRLGVRFINQIAVVTPENIADYLQEPPTCPKNLRLKNFVYQSTFSVPELPFDIRVIKIMQPRTPELEKSSGLFLDIDVATNSAISTNEAELDRSLSQIRWLKNKVFFTLVTPQSVKLFGGQE